MDIDLLSKMVKELILDNDRVALPGLGSFVAEIVPAAFTDKGYTINPPYRRLYFRSRPDQGEELAKFYAESNKVELTVADKIVKDFVAELKSVLHVKKTVIFPGLGRLRATKENTVFFVADEDLDIYPDGFGLEPISLKTHQESREEVAAAVVGLRSILEEASEPSPVPEPAAVPVPDEIVAVPEEIVEIPEEIVETEDSMKGLAQEPDGMNAVNAQADVGETEDAEEMQVKEAVQESAEKVMTESPEETEPEIAPGTPVKKSFWKTFLKVLLWTCVAAAALLVIYVAVSRLCPGILDSILYTPEELQIIKDL